MQEFLLNEIQPRIKGIYESFHKGTLTISHNDFRLDNLFIRKSDAPNSLPPVVLIDWQLAYIQAWYLDIALFLYGNLSEENIVNNFFHILCFFLEAYLTTKRYHMGKNYLSIMQMN